MNVPEELLYSRDHEWVQISGNVARIGITDFAQDALGDIVFVQSPVSGMAVEAGDSLSEVESTKSVSDIYAPVAGVISALNQSLAEEPSLINTDPYGEGWICEIEMSDPTQMRHLLNSLQYLEFVAG